MIPAKKTTILLSVLLSMFMHGLRGDNYRVLVGTYTRGTNSQGIYILEIDKKGNLLSNTWAAESDNPSYLALSPDGQFIYAVNETGKTSFVSAFLFDKVGRKLTPINRSAVAGDPCHVTVTPAHVMTANYSAGSIAVFGRRADGSITPVLQEIKQPPLSIISGRTGASNAHQIVPVPGGNLMMTTNLGTDRIFTYRYLPDGRSEPLVFVHDVELRKASGPRHLAFSNDGRRLYLVQELDAGITVLAVADDGKLTVLQETTLVVDSTQTNGAADIHLSPDGRYLYATNRGSANNITVFKVRKNGMLKKIAHYPTGGVAPRNFALSPDGKLLLIGNQKTNNISLFARKADGKLKRIKNDIALPAPVCLLFY